MIILLFIKCKFPGPNLSPYDGIVNTAGSLDQTYCLLEGNPLDTRSCKSYPYSKPQQSQVASELKLKADCSHWSWSCFPGHNSLG